MLSSRIHRPESVCLRHLGENDFRHWQPYMIVLELARQRWLKASMK